MSTSKTYRNAVRSPDASSAKTEVLFVSAAPPMHAGHGLSVYPHFVIKALEQRGIRVTTLIPNGLSAFGRPLARVGSTQVLGWIAVGPYAISLRPEDWARHLYRKIRALRKPRHSRKPKAVRLSGARQWRRNSDPLQSDVSSERRLWRALARRPEQVILVNSQVQLIGRPEHQAMSGKSVLVLTHDVAHERTDLYRRNNWDFDFTPLDQPAEARLLRQADGIVAISESDRVKLAAIAPGIPSVVCFPPIFDPETRPLPPAQTNNVMRCLFVGGGAAHNVDSVEWLLGELWPEALRACPRLQLLIGGGVGLQFKERNSPHPSVKFLGRVPDIAQAYANTDIVLAIVRRGSGVKMKLLEALHYGRPALTTMEGLRGFPEAAGAVFPQLSCSKDFADNLASLESDQAARLELAAAQRRWAMTALQPRELTLDLNSLINNFMDTSQLSRTEDN